MLGDEKMQLWKREEAIQAGDKQDRALYEKGKQHWINISPDLPPALPGAS